MHVKKYVEHKNEHVQSVCARLPQRTGMSVQHASLRAGYAPAGTSPPPPPAPPSLALDSAASSTPRRRPAQAAVLRQRHLPRALWHKQVLVQVLRQPREQDRGSVTNRSGHSNHVSLAPPTTLTFLHTF